MRVIIRKIYRTLIKIICFFIPNKKLRKKIRDNTYRSYCLIPIKKLRKMYPNSVFFWISVGNIGEFTQITSLLKLLKQKSDKNFVLITNKEIEKDIISFNFEDDFYCYYKKDLCFNYKKETENIISLPKNLEENKIYLAYKIAGDGKRKLVIDYLKDYYNLPQDTRLERIVVKRPNNDSGEFLELENLFKNEKIILIFPEANTYDYRVISKDSWVEIANKLTEKGFKCIFNTKEKYGDFQNIFLGINETIYLASLTKFIISFRSGMAELLALTTNCKMIIIYPNGTGNILLKENNKQNIVEKNNLERIKILNSRDSIKNCFGVENCEDYFYNNNAEFFDFICKYFCI